MRDSPRQYWIWILGLLTLMVTALFVGVFSTPPGSGASPMAPHAVEVEPNDTWSQANTYIIPGNMTGAITSTADSDYFKISTTSGQVYQVTLTRSGAQERRIDIYTNAYSWVSGAQTDPANATVNLSFQASGTLYYVRVTAPNNDFTTDPTDYTVDIAEPATPTNTPTHTATPTETPIPPPGNIPIETEPNDEIGVSDYFTVPGRIAGAITSIYDVDCYAADTVIGLQYRIILQDYEYNRWLKVYDANGHYVMGNTTGTNHEVELTLEATFNRYYLCVSMVTVPSSPNTTVDYLLEMIILQPTPTPTNTPTRTPTTQPTAGAQTATPKPTWPSGFDEYEPNFNFDTATTIAPGLIYDLNFMPWGGASVDNDYFKIRVKPGLQLTCETSDLDPGVDPRMVFYTGPAEQYFLIANDDIELGDFNSRISYYSTFEGYMYILVGQGDRMDLQAARNSAYSFECDLTVPGSNATPVPGGGGKDDPATPWPTSTPRPTSTPQTPSSPVTTPTPPEPTPTEEASDKPLDIRLVTTPQAVTPTPKPSGFRTFRVLVYYDANADGQFGAGEGVPGFFVRVLSPESKEELARGYTDDQGQLSFTVPTVGTVRTLVPLLGFDQLIEATKPEVTVRIAPPPLPKAIP